MSTAEDSNPLATVDDIHRRLLRPPSLNSPDDDHGGRSSQSKANSTPIHRKQETMKRKLEDYLDPALLSAISSKISDRVKNHPETRTKSKKEVKDFEWPVDELQAFMEDSHSMTETKSNKAVNLNDDLDLIGDGGDTDGEEEFCTPFRLYELTALKRFKRERDE